jgi:hypothetical protein
LFSFIWRLIIATCLKDVYATKTWIFLYRLLWTRI